MTRKILNLVLIGSVLSLTGCTQKKQVWIYTSLYKELVAEMDPRLKAAVPGVDFQWFQAGSENVAAKLNTELAAGRTKASLILTSDPFWYLELKKNGKLLIYESPAAKSVPAQYKDPDSAFVTVRTPTMVIAYNKESLTEAEAPKSWKELADPKWKGKITMGSPLESGTMFTAVAILAQLYGWEYFQTLRSHEIVAAGGNSSVITRIETKEKPVGIVLLENVLKAQTKGSPVVAVYPTDGTIPIPSPIAILKDTEFPEESKKAYDWFFSDEAQAIIRQGGMYSAVPPVKTPATAKSWSELKMTEWSSKLIEDIYAQREMVKQKFAEIIFR